MDNVELRNRMYSDAAVVKIQNKLSKIYNETVFIDSNDFWRKQLEYGTARENCSYTTEDALQIASKYGVVYTRANGGKGTYKYSDNPHL